MASVRPIKRVRGFAWIVQARDEHKVMRRATFYDAESSAAAEKAAREFAGLIDVVGVSEALRVRDERSGTVAQVVTLADWIDKYLDKSTGMLAAVTDGTRERYRQMAEATIKPQLGMIPIESVTRDDVARWVMWMEERPALRGDGKLSSKTIRNYHGFLSQVLAAAADRGVRNGNPARGAKIARTRRTKGMTVLTQTEFATLLHFIPEEHKPFVMWLAGTGMRWGEATALTWGDIDRDSRPMLVHIDKAWQRPVSGAGGRVLGPTKSEAGQRTISVPDALVQALGKPRAGDALVFENNAGNALWSGAFHGNVWQKAVAAANDKKKCAAAKLSPIGKTPRVHDLRHCHASWLIAAGRPLPYIQARLGHEKITTTVDTYGHLLPDAQQGDADAIGLAMAGVLPVIEEPRQIERLT